jgi:hypothetical protein
MLLALSTNTLLETDRNHTEYILLRLSPQPFHFLLAPLRRVLLIWKEMP